MLKKPEAIIFDFDNTLIDAEPLLIEAIRHTYKKYMGEYPHDKIVQEFFNHSFKDFLPNIFQDKWKEAHEFYYEYYIKNQDKLQPIKGAQKNLDLIKEKNIIMSIISNKQGRILRDEVSRIFGWSDYFISIVGSNDAKEDKPSAHVVNFALENFNADRKNIWFIGDSYADIACAYNSGCVPILFGNKDISDKPFKPQYIINNHADLYSILENILC